MSPDIATERSVDDRLPDMTGQPEPHVLTEVGGLVVAEDGALVLVVDRGTGQWATVAFVLGVLTLVFGGFGAVTLALAVTGHSGVPWWLSAILLLIGIVFAGAALGVLGRIRRARARPVGSYRPVAIFDRARRVFVDADGAVVAPLDHVRFQSRMQLTSSSPMLAVATPDGDHTLKRGNPFNGGLGNLEAVLNAAVFAPSR
jgi:hypothetical protein